MPTPELSVPAELDGMRPVLAQHIYALSQIPRRSGNEVGVREYITRWAEDRNLAYRTDEAGNIAVDIPATNGCEKKPLVIIQGHMDMVCNQIKDGTHDFEKDPIQLARTGDNVHSKGKKTTAGFDDSVAIAAGMALADDPEAVHGPITLLYTTDEEVGLTGANKLGQDMIQTDSENIVILNFDAEEGPHAIAHGSAAGMVTVAEMNLTKETLEDVPANFDAYTVTLKGLKSGHSGNQIHEGSGNAIMMLNKFLWAVKKAIPDFKLVALNGGEGISIIPAEATCQIAVPSGFEEELERLVAEWEPKLKKMLPTDKADTLSLSMAPSELPPVQALQKEVRNQLLQALDTLGKTFDGVLQSADPLHPTMSSTTGVIKTTEDKMTLKNHSRAAVNLLPELAGVVADMRNTLAKEGLFWIIEDGDLSQGYSGGYQGWQEREGSPAVAATLKAHQRLFDSDAKLIVFHAGVEVGALMQRIQETMPGKNVSAIAMGPHLIGAHTTEESLVVPTMDPTYDLLRGTTAELAA